MDDELFYSTRDLGLAATLSLSFSIEQINKANPKRVFFVFKNTDELQHVVEGYWLGSVKVDPKKFMDQIRNLKAAIYAK